MGVFMSSLSTPTMWNLEVMYSGASLMKRLFPSAPRKRQSNVTLVEKASVMDTDKHVAHSLHDWLHRVCSCMVRQKIEKFKTDLFEGWMSLYVVSIGYF